MTVRSHFTGLLCLATDILRYPGDERAKADLSLCERSLRYLDELALQAGSSKKCFNELHDIYSELLGNAREAIQQHEAALTTSLPGDILFNNEASARLVQGETRLYFT